MFLLFILESIGTPELILIAVVALIVFGPRKLPQMAKSIGKTMSDLKSSTNEFKATWEREAGFDYKTESVKEIETVSTENENFRQNSIGGSTSEKLPEPQIRELTADDIERNFQNHTEIKKESAQPERNEKQNWL